MPMSTSEIAQRLVTLCRQGQFTQAVEELFADDAVSMEPEAANVPKLEGKAAILQFGEQYDAMIEAHYGSEVSEPVVSSDFFSVMMSQDVKFKGRERSKEDEICVYEVKDGKIVAQQFFYRMP